MKVLFAASECAPIAKVGGLADVVGSLPKALAALGIEVAVAIPNYAVLGDNPPRILPGSDVPIYYLGSTADYPDSIYPGGYNEYKRYAMFCRQVVNFLDTRTFEPHVIHCHDYHTSLIPDIMHSRREKIGTVLTIHDAGNVGKADPSILTDADLSNSPSSWLSLRHSRENLPAQAGGNPDLDPRIREDDTGAVSGSVMAGLADGGHLDFLDLDLKDRNIEFLLQGILSADVINTVSPTYAKEIMSSEVSGGLADVLKARQARVFGILNGIDTDFFDPRRDANLSLNFGPSNALAAKKENKIKLQAKLGLKADSEAPLYAVVTRLVERKGLDLILKNMHAILGSGGQLLVLGKGDSYYEETLKGLAKISPKSLAFVNAFDETLSHQIYAGSDFFLVPSRTEPCGLTQMIAMRYGSLPIVNHTGGLADTVENDVTGFVFNEYTPESFLEAFQRSMRIYSQYHHGGVNSSSRGVSPERSLSLSEPGPAFAGDSSDRVPRNDRDNSERNDARSNRTMGGSVFEAMVKKAMGIDFSWKNSALSYIKLYEKALQYNFGIARTGGGEVRERPVGGWTLLSEGRSNRPFETNNMKHITDNTEQMTNISHMSSAAGHVSKESSVRGQLSDVENCPFETGHEHMSPGELFRMGGGEPDNPGWEVRVIPNKFPLVPAHEVVVYSPDHNKDLCDLPLLWVEKVVWTYLSRYRHYEDKGYVHVFCNHGQEAAASLNHPHSQVVVLDRLPDATLNSLEAAGSYFEKHHSCPYCDSLRREELTKNHLVWQNELMMVTTPYASDWPYELTILPKTHRQSFGNINDAELKALAAALQISIKLLNTQFPKLSYNFWIHSVPDLLGFAKTALYYHWHLDIAPRVKRLGGLELGTGVMVDDLISPEKAAQDLRGQLDSINQ